MAQPPQRDDVIPTESNPEACNTFIEYVDRHCTKGVDGYGNSKLYITLNELEKWWTIGRIGDLFLSFTPEIVLSKSTVVERYLRTLSILAYEGKVGYIHWFVSNDSDDARLPHDSMPVNLPGGEDLFKKFRNRQWMFSPYEFGKVPYMKPLDAECILPITIQEKLSPDTEDESRPVVHKVALHRVWNRLVKTDKEKIVVFKTYHGVESGQQLWENEVKTFQALMEPQRCDYIVECLGSFKQPELDQYTIILEYADGGTLLDLFKEDKAPRKHQDLVQFWERLFSLLVGLKRIHGLQADGTKGLLSLRCIHLDIKPSNILVFKGTLPGPQNCHFKLADFGSSLIRKVVANQKLTALDTGGTPMYSPPECCRDFRYLGNEYITIQPEADIWSLGCVFSEALVWTTMREEGREQYEIRRNEATRNVPRITPAGYGGCFHTIDARLVVVDTCHQEAQGIYASDKITPLVSDIILKHMLRPDLDSRLPSTNLHRIFKNEVQDKIGIQSVSGNAGKSKSKDQPVIQEPSTSLGSRKSKTWNSGVSGVSTVSSNEEGQQGPTVNTVLRSRSKRTQKPEQTSRVELPMVTVADVLSWRTDEGGSGRRFSRLLSTTTRRPPKGLKGLENLDLLKERDHIFLIDDSHALRPHQSEMMATFQALAYLVKRVDNDGLDMFFMSAPKDKHHNQDSTPLAKLIEKRSMRGFCAIKHSLDAMVDLVIAQCLNKERQVSLYILTDGAFGLKGKTLGGVDDTIKRLVVELKNRNLGSNYIALQFIRFGEVPDGIRRLKKLDNLAAPSVKNPDKKILDMDIVDHSSHTSSVWKMLIGSLVEGIDNDSEDDGSEWEDTVIINGLK